jgi:hypothetical protein
MSAIINFSINLEALPKEQIIKGKKGSYINLTMFANDETRYGNNASISLSQSKEEREAGNQKTYIGNGKVAWISPEGVSVAEREEDQAVKASSQTVSDGLPF